MIIIGEKLNSSIPSTLKMLQEKDDAAQAMRGVSHRQRSSS